MRSTSYPRPVVPRAARRGDAFTLVELLVVIGIIALLISILLPALNKARRAANTIVCGAQLRSIMQGAQIYAAQNRGAIPGSPWTTARFLINSDGTLDTSTFGEANCPSVTQIWDWASPIMRAQGIPFPSKIPGGAASSASFGPIDGPTGTNGSQVSRARADRYKYLTTMKQFVCPEMAASSLLSIPYSGSATAGLVGVTQTFSYCAPMGFLVEHDPTDAATGSTIGNAPGAFWNVPSSYSPQISKVGNPTRKIFVAEGAKYSTAGNWPPDFDISYAGTLGGAFADQGGADNFSRAWDRSLVPGNGAANGTDTRIYWARHGAGKKGDIGGRFKFQAVFFDGHVELLDDMAGMNPELWWPKGTVLKSGELWADVYSFYKIDNTKSFIVP